MDNLLCYIQHGLCSSIWSCQTLSLSWRHYSIFIFMSAVWEQATCRQGIGAQPNWIVTAVSWTVGEAKKRAPCPVCILWSIRPVCRHHNMSLNHSFVWENMSAAPTVERLSSSLPACPDKLTIIEWVGLQGTSKTIRFEPSTMVRVAVHQVRLPRAPSNLALNAFRNRVSTSLGSLCQHLTVLWVKNFFLTLNLNFPFCLKPSFLLLSIQASVKKSLLTYIISPFKNWKAAMRFPQRLLFSR